MKIALFSAFYPYRGGIAQFSALLYRALEKEHELTAYTFKKQYPNFLFPGSSQFVTEEDQADRIPARRMLDSTNPATFVATAKAINSDQPEVFISQYWMTFFGPSLAAVQKRIRGVKRISILHNVIPHEKRFFDSWANRRFLKQCDGFVVLSDAVLHDLLSLKPDAKYLRIDHPVYNQFGAKLPREQALDKLGLSADKKYLLFFGIIRDYKGLDVLLHALEETDQPCELIVAGESYGSFEKYQNIIEARGLSDRVHIYNKYITDDEVSTFFSAANVCVLPYKGATQSGITAIAHHFDMPIIATDVGGLQETIEDGKTGLIVERPEAALLASAIQRYFERDYESTFAVNIRAAKSGNTWENFAHELINFSKGL